MLTRSTVTSLLQVEGELDGVLAGALGTELGAVVVEALEAVRGVVVGSPEAFSLAPLINRVLLHMLACNQSTRTSEPALPKTLAMGMLMGPSNLTDHKQGQSKHGHNIGGQTGFIR